MKLIENFVADIEAYIGKVYQVEISNIHIDIAFYDNISRFGRTLDPEKEMARILGEHGIEFDRISTNSHDTHITVWY